MRPANPAPIPLGRPLSLRSAAAVLVAVTPRDVAAAVAYWEQHAKGLTPLLRSALTAQGPTP